MAKKKRSSRKADSSAAQPLDFEKALAEVEQIVRALESGELGLTDSLAHYEQGIEKIKLCHKVLQNAEKRIAILTEVHSDGTAEVEPVDVDGSDEEPEAEPDDAEVTESPSRRASRTARGAKADVDENQGLF